MFRRFDNMMMAMMCMCMSMRMMMRAQICSPAS